jgi:hypothetical protein
MLETEKFVSKPSLSCVKPSLRYSAQGDICVKTLTLSTALLPLVEGEDTMCLSNGAIRTLADPLGKNLCSRVLGLEFRLNPALESLDFSRGESAADLSNFLLMVGAVGCELPLVAPLLIFYCPQVLCPGACREVLRVGQVVLLEPAERFDVKVRLTCLGKPVINKVAQVSLSMLFKQRGGKGCLLLREAEIICLVRPVELLLEVPHDLLWFLNGGFIDGKCKGKLGLYTALVEVLVIFEETCARVKDEVKPILSGVFFYSVAFDEISFFKRFKVFAELIANNNRLIFRYFQSAEPHAADFRIVFSKYDVLRFLLAVDI